MTEVDSVMHEGGAPVPGCSPNNNLRQTATVNINNNAIVDSSLDDAEAEPNDDAVVAASNHESNDSTEIATNLKASPKTTTSASTKNCVSKISTTTTSNANNNNNSDQANNSNEATDQKKNANKNVGDDDPVTAMEAEDGEDDSQVTSSSTDIGGDADGGVGAKSSIKTPQSTTSIEDDNSNSHHIGDDEKAQEKAKPSKTPAASYDDVGGESSQSCDTSNADSQKSESTEVAKQKQKDEKASTKKAADDVEDMNVSPKFESAKVASPAKVSELLHEPLDVDGAATVGDNADADVDNEDDPLGGASNDAIDNAKNSEKSLKKVTNNASPDNNNGAIVELDDTDDDDNGDDDDEEMHSNASQTATTNANKHSNGNDDNSKSMCIDSDDPVVIGSDSESETNNSIVTKTPAATSQKSVNAPAKVAAPTTHVIDDDDDDCVVVEDESSPMGGGTKNNSNELVKRKSLAIDGDDSQPPSKRQRSGITTAALAAASSPGLTIKNARSLTPSDLSVASGNKSSSAIIYPVNIAPAGNTTAIGPPKLAPLGGGSGVVGSTVGSALAGVGSIMPGLSNLSSTNANLLPGLTDDMFVLEAPSFIVPYIYEKPPGNNLKTIVKDIEAKYELTKEDLVEADKSDEFDMMTEQNKTDRDPESEQAAKKKKKKRNNDDVDDSWSEESDEDDDDEDDDDSDAGVRTKVLIKEATDDLAALKGAIKPAAAVVAQSTPGGGGAATLTAAGAGGAAGATKTGQENYFESPLGKFFMDIGVGLVQEFVQSDLIRLQKRKMRKTIGNNIGDFERAITALSGNLEASKKKNAPYKFTMKRCEFCNFKSESALAMANHYETPHMNGPLYKCNFCTFEIRNATEIVYHMEAMHNIKARLIKPLPYHQCPNCGFEDNGKAKLARHQPVCAKKFRPEINLAPPNDWEAPAKIPRIKPRHGLVGTATAYQAMAAQQAAQKAAIATIQQQQQQAQARNIQAATLAAQNAAKLRGRAPALAKGVAAGGSSNGTASLLRGQSPVGPRSMATNVVLPNNYQIPGNQMLQANALAGKKTSLPGQPSISITPLPRQGASPQTATPSTSRVQPAKPGKAPNAAAGNSKAQFVICEICDGYIKDLEQLRNHMQWMHEVKIHPKMIYNRPPLNCQKCQFRFFTDQGLERHLLGSHGLVTSSMQEAANNGKDSGRCPVCGRMYQWKLLNHVARDHHMTLKPAHLSYKCTVCTATFGMYKQFETHVYTAHSTVAKKAMDGKKNSAAAAGGAAGSGNNAVGGVGASSAASSGGGVVNSRAAANDALLKPLKINDEITIIPQPASKSRITNMESHVID